MSIQDDFFDLEDHFKKVVNKNMQDAWIRVSKAHADLERYQMKTEEAMQGFSAMLRAFSVKRD